MLSYLSFSSGIDRAAKAISVLLVLTVIHYWIQGSPLNDYAWTILLTCSIFCLDWIITAGKTAVRAARVIGRVIA